MSTSSFISYPNTLEISEIFSSPPPPPPPSSFLLRQDEYIMDSIYDIHPPPPPLPFMTQAFMIMSYIFNV